MPNRDPRVDPRPGDVLIYGPQWQMERAEVLGLVNGEIAYRYRVGGSVFLCSLNEWQDLMRGAEVIHAAE